MPRVQVDRPRSQVALTPVAAPVNTFVQAAAPAPTANEMRAKILEGALSNVTNYAIKEGQAASAERTRQAEKDALIAASASFVEFKTGVIPKLRDLSPEAAQQKIEEEFGTLYEGVTDATTMTALNQLKVNFLDTAMTTAAKEQTKKRTQGWISSSISLVGEINDLYINGAISAKEAHSRLDNIINNAAFTNQEGEDFAKPDRTALNAAVYSYFADQKDSDLGWTYVQANKHDRSKTPEYETAIDAMRNNFNSRLNGKWEMDWRLKLADAAANGRVNQVNAMVETVIAEGEKRGIQPVWAIQFKQDAITNARKTQNLALKAGATERAVAIAVSTYGSVEPVSWVDAEGKIHETSPSEVRNIMLNRVRPDPQNPNADYAPYFRVLNNTKDPLLEAQFNSTIESLKNINDADPEVAARAAETFKLSVNFFSRLEESQGLDAVRKQLNGDERKFEVYQIASKGLKMGMPERDIAQAAYHVLRGKGVPPTAKQLDTMLSEAVDKFDTIGERGFWSSMTSDPKFYASHIGARDYLAYYYSMAAPSAATPEAAMETAVEMLHQNFVMVEDDNYAFLLNSGDTKTINGLLGRKPDAPVSRTEAKAAYDKLPRATEAIMTALKAQFPYINPDDKKVMLSPDPMKRGTFKLVFEGGGGVHMTQRFTADQIIRAERAASKGEPFRLD